MYTPDKVQVEHKGFGGELMGCMSREIKTFFDLDNAPFSKMVLGEVLNLPGKWSSYPPHHHPQPEVYFYRFDYPDGFGAGFANGEISRRSTMAAPSSTMASTPRPPRRAMPCATPGASDTWRGIPGQDPHRRSGARLAVEGRCQRPHLSQSLTGGNHPMKTVRLTMAQALVRFLENQYIEVDGEHLRFVRGVFIIPGHGNVVGLGQALSQEAKHLEIWHGQNEQGMAQAAVAFAKQMKRKQICVATSSVGPGAANMVTACGTATANNIPLLVLPGDVYACRQPDPVLQQVEQTNNLSISTNDAFKAVCRYWIRIVRPEQLMSAMISAFRVLTDPANTGAVCIAMPQDVEGEAYDYPESFFKKRVWRLERRPATEAALADAAEV
ncbi:MAG: 5-deoxy-glucuronate isomerase, partial [Oscillospiraceae bacterium]